MERIAATYRQLRSLVYIPAIVLFVATYAVIAARYPYGGWDGWGIWNSRAAHFAFSDNLRTAVDGAIRQPDYPPLLPIIIAAGWRLFGYTLLVPAIIHGAIYGMLLWLFRRDLLLLGIVGAVGLRYAPTQYADTLLALWLVLTLINHKQQTLSGIFLGLACLTKNEGLLMLVAYLVATVIIERAVPWRAMVAVLPFIVVLALYKIWVGTPNDIVGVGNSWERLVSLDRYSTTALFLFLQFVYFAHSSMLILLSLGFLRRLQCPLSVPIVTLAVIFVGYFAVYIVTPHELMWHLSTSSDRLMLHLLPAFAYYISTCPSKDIDLTGGARTAERQSES